MSIDQNDNGSSYETETDEECCEDMMLARVIADRDPLYNGKDYNNYEDNDYDNYDDDNNNEIAIRPRATLRPFVPGQEHRRGTQTAKRRALNRQIMEEQKPTIAALGERIVAQWEERKQILDGLDVGADPISLVVESERSHSFRKACSERTLEHCRRHAPTANALAEMARAPYLFNPDNLHNIFSVSAASDQLDSNILRFYIRTLILTVADLKQRIIDHKKRWPGHEYHWAAWDAVLPALAKDLNVFLHYIGTAYKSTPADRHKQDIASQTTQQRFLSTLLQDWPDDWTVREMIELRWKMTSNGLAKLLPRQLYCVNPNGAEVEELLIDLALPFSANSAFGGYRAPKLARIPPDLDLIITKVCSFFLVSYSATLY